MISPTQRTLKELRSRKLPSWIVERFISQAGAFGKRIDLFNIIDIIALDFKRGVVGVQSTGQDYSGHYKKLTVEKAKESIRWLSTPGAHLELWGWRKVKVKRGGKAMVYKPRIKVFSLDDFSKEDVEKWRPK